MMHSIWPREFWQALRSPWTILLLLTIGWAPLFFADLLRSVRPALNATYGPQAFAMSWLMITLWCSVLAVVLAIGHSIRLIKIAVKQLAKPRRDHPSGGSDQS